MQDELSARTEGKRLDTIPFAIGFLSVFAFIVSAIAFPEPFIRFMDLLQDKIVKDLGWASVFFSFLVMLFTFGIVCSPIGSIRIGGRDAKPDFSFFRWFAISLCSGIGIGMISTCIPVITVVVGTVLAYGLASGDWHFTGAEMSKGLYGIGIAAVGMLSTLGLTLATDAYGPISDNAGGNAEMSKLDPEVRRRTDALDALGNTTAATGKGFAIGSAALTALALLASYIEELKISILHWSEATGNTIYKINDAVSVEVSKISTASLSDFMGYFQVTLMNPKVLMGLFVGAMMSFMFCGLTMNAVGRAAEKMVKEVRRQFKEIKGILTGEAEPDYVRCVEISTAGAQHEMIWPSVLAVITPICMGIVFGVPGVFGLLAGGLASGFVLAVFMANSGGAWDNAKKYIEQGHVGGKGSESHKAAVIGDTVGDPFKDTSGPSLNILIKLMSMVAIVTAGVNIAVTLF